MNDTERIVEVTGYSKQVPIIWHDDPTRHLLKQRAVNAKSDSGGSIRPARKTESSKPKTNKQDKTD